MLRKSKSPVPLALGRSGGAITLSRLDIWKPTVDDWALAASVEFKDATKPKEALDLVLPKGLYTCVFQCFVEESLNGKYAFEFEVAGKKTYFDDGDVNTTAAPDDSKVFKDQFVLEVTGASQ